MDNMFCFQCEQTANGTGCSKFGVCGKSPVVSNSQDDLTAAMVNLAVASNGESQGSQVDELLMQGLFTTITNVSFDEVKIEELKDKIVAKTEELGGTQAFTSDMLFLGDDKDVTSLRSTLLLGLRGMSAYAWHAHVLGVDDDEVTMWHYKVLYELTQEHTVEEWLKLLMDFGMINLKCMELLDKAHNDAYGQPAPNKVSMTIEKGPFIVVTGHDLHDLKQLLEQTDGKGINIYTHGEMLPAHGYPELNKYEHLKGNFGTAWQNQKKEFDNVPGAFLFTTNCLMPPKDTYKQNIFTTAVVQFPGVMHIEGDAEGKKDFAPVIAKALELGGYAEDTPMYGINGGNELMTGFAHGTVLSVADTVIEAVKSGTISHFFLVGGCDGARPGRNYYTDFVKQSPDDSIILTLACGKYRFNDLDLGTIGGLPRIMDMGQCNDAYSAIKVAVALSEAFECGVNELPLTLVLSWYEQKAVCILLTLLALGINNILIGPTIPAFFSPNVVSVLVDKFGLTPITTPEEDLKKILEK